MYRNGMLHLVWSLGWHSRTELTVPRLLNDSRWHTVALSRARQALDLVVDGERFGSAVAGGYFELNVENHVYFGNFS
jgi:hypothetical protein